ncbi:MAG: heme-binding protein [Hyphomicrobiales bacterium]|nr:heme-binding protein [Hyphomicrobiales bacterium]MBV9752208.1 heme-binding protein [Hyphomicrobiales bacterium]MBV9974152.1 heme-binding protein [Hyphomicrobiales bacterium]
MKFASHVAVILACATLGSSAARADTLATHRIPAALAVEAATETIAECAKQGYRETAVVLDADGAVIVSVRGDGAGIHTLDSAHDKAYTSVSFKNDTLALAERAKGEESIAPLSKLPHVMFFGGGVVIKLGDEVIGSIGAAGAPGAKLDDNCARAGLAKIQDRLK